MLSARCWSSTGDVCREFDHLSNLVDLGEEGMYIVEVGWGGNVVRIIERINETPTPCNLVQRCAVEKKTVLW